MPLSGLDTADLLVTTGRINPWLPFPFNHKIAFDLVVPEPMATSFWAVDSMDVSNKKEMKIINPIQGLELVVVRIGIWLRF